MDKFGLILIRINVIEMEEIYVGRKGLIRVRVIFFFDFF